MRGFILGVIITLVVLFVAGLLVAEFGLFPTSADATPPSLERRIAMTAMDSSMDRHAPRAFSPIPATDDNLIDGAKLYTMNCALCHGTMDYKPSALEHSMYPPPPQLILDPLDDPEWHIYYAIRTGVRYTGMPAWGHVMNEQDMWKVTMFLSRLEKLPPGVLQYWKNAYGVSPENHQNEGHEQHGAHEHHD
jgi:mono/diheme cytochrome c family protein